MAAAARGDAAPAGRRSERPATGSRPDWPQRLVAPVERHWPWALAALLGLAAALLLYMGRGLSFFFDDWDFVTHDYGGGLHSLLQAHVGNISVFPVAVYKVLFHLVGLNHYAVFRSLVVILDLVCGALVFVLASRRVGRVPALLAAALILFLGAAWEDLLWAFQIGYMLSVAGGLATWWALEREDRPGDIAALVFLTVSMGSSSLGIAVMVGVAVELAWRRDWRRAWIVLIPAALYVLWYLGYGESQVTENSLINAPGFAADLAAAAFGGLIGRDLEWGRPLAAIAILLALWRLAQPVPISARLAGLLATAVALWAVTAAARSTISQPDASRYIYLGAVVIVLTGVELLRGSEITPRATLVAGAAVGFCVLTGLTVLHNGSARLRGTSHAVTAELGALELAGAYAPPEYEPDSVLAPQIKAAAYLHTVRAIGSSPADTPAQLRALDPATGTSVDRVLVALEGPTLSPLSASAEPTGASAPTVVSVNAGAQARQGGCVVFTPNSGATVTGALTVPAGGLAIRSGQATVSLAVKRFAETFTPIPGTLAPHSRTKLVIRRDADAMPWQLQLASSSGFAVCGL